MSSSIQQQPAVRGRGNSRYGADDSDEQSRSRSDISNSGLPQHEGGVRRGANNGLTRGGSERGGSANKHWRRVESRDDTDDNFQTRRSRPVSEFSARSRSISRSSSPSNVPSLRAQRPSPAFIAADPRFTEDDAALGHRRGDDVHQLDRSHSSRGDDVQRLLDTTVSSRGDDIRWRRATADSSHDDDRRRHDAADSSRGDDIRWRRATADSSRDYHRRSRSRTRPCDDDSRHRTRAPSSSQQWTHDRFYGPSEATRDDERDDDLYSSVRRSKAYDSENTAGPARSGNQQQAAEPSTSVTGTNRGRHRSASPRPSHDQFEWKSRAGGVAIFVRASGKS